jgi:hypothetical protein
LGLAIVHDIVVRHGGDVRFVDASRGACVVVVLSSPTRRVRSNLMKNGPSLDTPRGGDPPTHRGGRRRPDPSARRRQYGPRRHSWRDVNQ